MKVIILDGEAPSLRTHSHPGLYWQSEKKSLLWGKQLALEKFLKIMAFGHPQQNSQVLSNRPRCPPDNNFTPVYITSNTLFFRFVPTCDR